MRKKFGCGLLVLALVCQLTVAAVNNGNPSVVCRPGTAPGSASLSLAGLTGPVYGAQLELLWNEPQTSASFSPRDAAAYSPRCLVQTVGSQTRVTVYLDLTACPTQGAAPELGTLQLGGAYTAPVQARITLLDRDLKPYDNASGAWVGVNNTPPSSGGGGSGYWISATASAHGSLRTDPAQAQPDTEVTVYAVPEAGYRLEELTACDAAGQRLRLVHVRNERYTFSMPASPVSVSAVFAPQTGGQPVDPSQPDGGLPFTDVRERDWFYDAVDYVYSRGLMSGTGETLFSPNVTTTRAMIVAILYKLEGQPESGLSDFTDVSPRQYYAAPVAWAASHGLVSGYGGGLFGPNDPITREQMARILFQYAQMKGYSTQERADLSGYTDAERISGYALDAMRWANALGLINGLDDGRLAPGGGATRAQAASILMNFCENAAR